MRIKSLLWSCLLGCAWMSGSGQEVLIDHYYANNFLTNPAIAGIEKYVDVQIGQRWQWRNVDGAPQTTYLTIHGAVGEKTPHRMGFSHEFEEGPKASLKQYQYYGHQGVGMVLLVEQIGPFSRQIVSPSYAFHLPVSGKWMFSMGVSPGIAHTGFRRDQITTTTASDPILDNFQSTVSPTLGNGVLLYSKRFYLGASRYQNFGIVFQYQSYSIMSGVRFRDWSEDWVFHPFAAYRTLNNRAYLDLGMKVQWKSRIWLATNLRTNKAAAIAAGLSISPNLSVSVLRNGGMYHSKVVMNSNEITLIFRVANQLRVFCPQELW